MNLREKLAGTVPPGSHRLRLGHRHRRHRHQPCGRAALSQDASPSLLPTASPSPIAQPLPVAEATSATAPAATPHTAANPTAPAGASLAPGATISSDPCAAQSPWPTLAEGVTPGPGATHAPHPNLCAAQPNGADPLALLAWVFTPIFQTIFLGLALLYSVTGDIGISIILLTIIIRIFLIPVFRVQITSQRRMQMVQPELRAIQQKYKATEPRSRPSR